MNCMFSCDWMELLCDARQSPLLKDDYAEHLSLDERYVLQLQMYQTRVFRRVYKMYYIPDLTKRDAMIDFLTIVCDPLSKRSSGGIMDDGLCHVKLGNYWLYTTKWLGMMEHALGQLVINPKRAARIDICCDLQYFACGISAANLMHGLSVDKYRKVHQPKWTLYAVDGQERKYYNTLTFGSKCSNVFTRFYNKSLELKESGKSYIVEAWRDNSNLDLSKDVYRLEFEMHDCGLKSVDKSTGAVIEIDWREVADRNRIAQLFVYYSAYYWDIRKSDNARKDRCTRLSMFTAPDGLYKAWSNPRYKLSTRTAKIVYNWLQQHATEICVTKSDVASLALMLYALSDHNYVYVPTSRFSRLDAVDSTLQCSANDTAISDVGSAGIADSDLS